MKGRAKSLVLFNLPLILILFLAAAVRIALLSQRYHGPFFTYLRIDEIEYNQWAMNVLQGHPFPDTIANHGPGYPWLLGIIYLVFGRSLLAVRAVQMSFGLICVVLVHRIGLRLFGAGAALVSALIMALYWPALIFEQRILAASLVVLMNLALLYALIRATARDKPGAFALAGFVAGLAVIVRPLPLYLLAVIVCWLLVRAARQKSLAPALQATALVAAAGALLIPVMLGNHAASGRWRLVQEEAGLNFYLGNNPNADGTPYARPGGVYDALLAMPVKQAGIFDPSRQDEFYTKQAAAFAAHDPAAFLALLVRKTALVFNRGEFRATINPGFERSLARVTSLPLPGFALVLAFALPGLLALRMGRRAHQALVIYLATYAAFIIATVVSGRYRLPFAAGLIVLAGAGFMEVAGLARAFADKIRSEKNLPSFMALAPLLLLAAGLAIAYLPVGPHYTNAEDYAWLGEAWLAKGDLARADDNLQKALSLDPGQAEAMMGKARLEQKKGGLDFALAWLEKAAAADPGSGMVHFQLGRLLWNMGEKRRAIKELERVIELKPQWLPGYNELARREWELGMTKPAITHLEAILAMYPDFEQVKALIADLQRRAAQETKP